MDYLRIMTGTAEYILKGECFLKIGGKNEDLYLKIKK